MWPQLSRELSLADHVTIGNAIIGLIALLLVSSAPRVTAQLVLLAAIFDGLDGVVARRYGSSPIGEYLDALADAISFGLVPAVLVVAIAHMRVTGTEGRAIQNIVLTDPNHITLTGELGWMIGAVAVAALYLRMALIRLGHYTVHDTDTPYTSGVPTTLAASMLAALYLLGTPNLIILFTCTVLLAFLMVTDLQYTDLSHRDALGMGTIQFAAVIAPTQFNRAFPMLWIICASLYLVLGPHYYTGRTPASHK